LLQESRSCDSLSPEALPTEKEESMSAMFEYGFALGCKRLNELWQNNSVEVFDRASGIFTEVLDIEGQEFVKAFNDFLEAVTS